MMNWMQIIAEAIIAVILLLALMGLAGYCFLSGLDYEIRHHADWGEAWLSDEGDRDE